MSSPLFPVSSYSIPERTTPEHSARVVFCLTVGAGDVYTVGDVLVVKVRVNCFES